VIKELRESGVPLDDLDITIVDDDFSHFLGFTLPWVIRGWHDHDTVFIHSNTEALPGIITVVGSVQAIDPEHKTITLADNTEIRSDKPPDAQPERGATARLHAGAEPLGQTTMEHQHRDHIRGSRIVTGLSGILVALKYRHPDRVAFDNELKKVTR
jgi:sulfide:quinone oxidoreductase